MNRKANFLLLLFPLLFLLAPRQVTAGYDPIVGRWLSRDPLPSAEFRQGPNLYAYVSNNPVNTVDPLGLWNVWNPATWGIGGFEGVDSVNPVGRSAEWNNYRAIDFSEGLYAGVDGAIPFWDPFADEGFYDECDEDLKISRKIGEYGRDVELTLLGAAGGIRGAGYSYRLAFTDHTTRLADSVGYHTFKRIGGVRV
jgi:hypothetical protein